MQWEGGQEQGHLDTRWVFVRSPEAGCAAPVNVDTHWEGGDRGRRARSSLSVGRRVVLQGMLHRQLLGGQCAL